MACLVLLAILGPACGPTTSAEKAGVDQEITRNIMWKLREDTGRRFQDVRVSCEGREILIEGRVSDNLAAQDALQIASSSARGGRIVSRLDVRLR
jgi:osmotically-inducible protein OsmY